MGKPTTETEKEKRKSKSQQKGRKAELRGQQQPWNV